MFIVVNPTFELIMTFEPITFEYTTSTRAFIATALYYNCNCLTTVVVIAITHRNIILLLNFRT